MNIYLPCIYLSTRSHTNTIYCLLQSRCCIIWTSLWTWLCCIMSNVLYTCVFGGLTAKDNSKIGPIYPFQLTKTIKIVYGPLIDSHQRPNIQWITCRLENYVTDTIIVLNIYQIQRMCGFWVQKTDVPIDVYFVFVYYMCLILVEWCNVLKSWVIQNFGEFYHYYCHTQTPTHTQRLVNSNWVGWLYSSETEPM